MYKISVVIPVKNRSRDLKRALESVLAQTHQNFEILVVDDHSEEDIEQLIRGFNDDRIFYFKNNKMPSNANVCRNIGIAHAKGNYVAMLDSDDEWLPLHLELGLAYLIKNDLDGIFGGFIIDNGVERKERESRPLKPGENMVNYILADGVAVTPSQIYKSSCCKKLLWDEDLLRHQDYDYSVRFHQKYQFENYPHLTCVVHWDLNEKRKVDIASQKRFMEKHKAIISHVLFVQYHTNVYYQIRDKKDVSEALKNYFAQHLKFNYHEMTFTEYLGLKEMKITFLRKLYMKIKFTTLIIIN